MSSEASEEESHSASGGVGVDEEVSDSSNNNTMREEDRSRLKAPTQPFPPLLYINIPYSKVFFSIPPSCNLVALKPSPPVEISITYLFGGKYEPYENRHSYMKNNRGGTFLGFSIAGKEPRGTRERFSPFLSNSQRTYA